MTQPRTVLRLTPRPHNPGDIHCPQCRKLIFDAADRVLLSRVTRFRDDGAFATCKVCKTEVRVPVRVMPDPDMGWARFALGWYTQLWIAEGKVPMEDMREPMQSFVNLLADGCEVPRPPLARVLAAEASVPQEILDEARARWPSLLPPAT